MGRAGHDVTVVEIAPGLRSGGQTVDLRSGSREVLRRLGLLEQCLDVLIDQAGFAWVDENGRRTAEMPVTAFGGKGFVSSEELLRSDLARVLHDAVPPSVRHLFSDSVTAIEQTTDRARVSFRHNASEDFDLVVGADGTHSNVRSLAFDPAGTHRRSLGLAHAWFTLTENATTPGLDGWYLVHNAPGRLVVEARPGHHGRQEVGLTFPAVGLPDRRDRGAQLELLQASFEGVGWRAAEIVEAARDAPDFALDVYEQIRVDAWHRGRIVLLGDSAWCSSPLSGMGTALALHGAEALATALADHPLAEALPAFQRAMQPRATKAAKLFPGRVRQYAPRTRRGIATVARIVDLVQLRPVEFLLTRAA